MNENETRNSEEQRPRTKHKKRRKKLKWWAVALIVLGSLVLVLACVAGGLVWGLLDGINRPETPTQFTEDEEPEETAGAEGAEGTGDTEPSATPETQATPGPTLRPVTTYSGAVEEPLPLEDVYTQTHLTGAQKGKLNYDAALTGDYINVLLIGVDRRDKSNSYRTDTIMIATVDKANNRLKITSLMRDMLVNIPGYDYDKLNAAAVHGGIELLMQTINESFYMNITEYVLVDFSMFTELIDGLGGVTVRMTAEEISAANDCIAGLNKQTGVDYLWDGFIFADEGNVKLTGKQALGYARIRKIDSDITRTQRQFKVLNAAYAIFRSSGLSRQYALLDKLMPYIETNIDNAKILDYMLTVSGMDVSGLLDFHIPADGCYQSGKYNKKSVLLADIPQSAMQLHQFVFDCADEAETARILDPNPSLPPRTPTPTMEGTEGWPDGTVPDITPGGGEGW